MIHARDFVEPARAAGFARYAGVPCSFLTPFINYVIADETLEYVSAANEGDAIAIAAGMTVGGQRAIAMMQNSGLGNAVSPLTSLTHTFEIPVLIVCTHRGAPGVADEPQHALMGTITENLFETMKVAHAPFPMHAADVADAIGAADQHMRKTRRPYAFIMQKGTCEPHPLAYSPTPAAPASCRIDGIAGKSSSNPRASRQDVLRAIVSGTDMARSVVVATTGYTGRELYAIDDRANQLYMVGSMGCAASFGLGLALAQPALKVIVIDGDGGALMRMGNLATIGAYGPGNLTHFILDNEAHDSTGGQATVSATVDFAAVAAACGYREAVRCADPERIAPLLEGQAVGPRLIHVKIRAGTIDPLPRPAISPPDVHARFAEHISSIADIST